jgi:hypothetical protein
MLLCFAASIEINATLLPIQPYHETDSESQCPEALDGKHQSTTQLNDMTDETCDYFSFMTNY